MIKIVFHHDFAHYISILLIITILKIDWNSSWVAVAVKRTLELRVSKKLVAKPDLLTSWFIFSKWFFPSMLGSEFIFPNKDIVADTLHPFFIIMATNRPIKILILKEKNQFKKSSKILHQIYCQYTQLIWANSSLKSLRLILYL